MSKDTDLRVVIDKNIFVSGLIAPQGNSRRLIEQWLDSRFQLLMSPLILHELTRVLREGKAVKKYRVEPPEVEALIALVTTFSIPIEPQGELPVAVRDPNDAIVLACALDGRANYLVTGDKDLLTLQGDPAIGPLQIVAVSAFQDILTVGRSLQNEAGEQ